MKYSLFILSTLFFLVAYSQDKKTLHYEELQKAITIEIDGFEAQEPEGSTMNYGSATYSVAHIRFTNEDGDFINISLMDYSNAQDIFNATTMPWAMGFTLDSNEEKAGGVSLSDNLKGWESIKKKTGEVSLTLGVKERYILVIEMNNQTDTEKAKTVAKKVKTESLPS